MVLSLYSDQDCSSVSGQVLCSDWLPGITRCVPQDNFALFPCNKFLTDQVCLVKMVKCQPRYSFLRVYGPELSLVP